MADIETETIHSILMLDSVINIISGLKPKKCAFVITSNQKPVLSGLERAFTTVPQIAGN